MKKIVLILGILLANNLFAYLQEDIAKCLGGNVGSCDKAIHIISYLTISEKEAYHKWLQRDPIRGIEQGDLQRREVNCNTYMKVLKKGCALGSGVCCAFLGNEYHSISVYESGKWRSKYGANCSLKNQNEAFKFYKKACNLGESLGCERYSEFEMDLAEIQERERDKTQKSDITIRRK